MGKIGSKPTKTLIDFDNLQESEIIRLASEGNQEACTIIVNKYKNSLLAYITNYITSGKGKLNIEIAEEPQDICQESLHKIFKNIHLYNPKYSFSTWIYSIAQNTAIDYFRKRKMEFEPEALNDTSITASGINPKNSPEDKLISRQEYLTLIKYIDNLPDIYKDIARLRFIEEYAIEEIAESLNLPANTVKTRIKRAKAILLKTLS